MTISGTSLPPVPLWIKEKIISGEFIDLATLLPKAMFSGSSEPETSRSLTLHLTPTGNDLFVHPTSSRRISSFASWMEAWNIYLAILIDYSSARASQLVAYQRIITSANNHYPPAAWLNYDVQFRTLAASDPFLRWDVRHTDLWLQCVTSTPSPAIYWPCPHCGATNHYPANRPFRLHVTPISSSGQSSSTISTTSSGQQPPQEDSLITDHLPAMHLTVQLSAAKTAHSLTTVNSVVPTTAPAKAVLLNKPKPWTPI